MVLDELDDLIWLAFEQGREVRLEPADDYGIHVVVDDVAVTSSRAGKDAGLPWENFQGELRNPTDAAEAKIAELQRAFVEDRIDASGDVPRIKGTDVPVPQLRRMHAEDGMWAHKVANWFPDVNWRDVEAAVLYGEFKADHG